MVLLLDYYSMTIDLLSHHIADIFHEKINLAIGSICNIKIHGYFYLWHFTYNLCDIDLISC